MFDVVKVAGMIQWVQAAGLQSCTIARHLELKERIEARIIAELKEELVRLRESHTGEVCLLEERVKRVEDKYVANQK